MSFWWDRRLGRGQFLIITIPVKEKSFQIRARVVYSLKDARTGHFRTGVEFKDPESAFRARLAEETIEMQAEAAVDRHPARQDDQQDDGEEQGELAADGRPGQPHD